MSGHILSAVNKIIPKRRYISFSSFPDFSDNARTLYEYIISHDTFFSGYKYVWHVDGDLSQFKVNNTGTIVVRKKSIASLLYFMKSSIIFSTHGLYNVIKTTSSQKVCLLWHGMPLKKIGYLYEKDIECGVQTADYYFVTSHLFRDLFQKIFHAKEENVIITGQPRNDELFSQKPELKQLIRQKLGEHIVFYLPTYRKSSVRNTVDGIMEDDKFFGATMAEWVELNDNFSGAGKMMVIKPHPMEAKRDFSFMNELKSVKIINEDWLQKEGITLYMLLSQCEVLITDYSSVYIDYMLLNRPIVFYVPDMKSYSDSRGFLFDNIYEFLPGQVVESFKDITHVLLSKDMYSEKRRNINMAFNEITTPNSCKNIIAFLTTAMMEDKHQS